MDFLARLIRTVFHAFHTQTISLADTTHPAYALNIDKLQETRKQQYQTYESELRLMALAIQKSQRTIHREFGLAIADYLSLAYHQCAGESDPDTATRMKEHIATTGVELFLHCAGRVQDGLVHLMGQIEQVVVAVTRGVGEQMVRDYSRCIVTPVVQVFSSGELRVKRDIAEFVHQIEMEMGLDDLLDECEVEDDGAGARDRVDDVGYQYYYQDQGQWPQAAVPARRVLESIQEEDEED